MPTRFALRWLVVVLALCGVAACARPSVWPFRDNWQARYAPDPGCTIRVTSGGDAPSAGTGALVVRVSSYSRWTPVARAKVTLKAPAGTIRTPDTFQIVSDTLSVHVFSALPAGPYEMRIGPPISGIIRNDTVAARPGAVDTVHVAVESFEERYRNVHNCQPHKFRRDGESACVTDPSVVTELLDRARKMASSVHREGEAPSDEPPELIRDEQMCERAGRAYGGRGGPPRRMALFRIGELFLAYDPYEPAPAGEWNAWGVFDRRWHYLYVILGS